MSVNISIMQAVSLYFEGQQYIKIGQKLLDKFKSERNSKRNNANIELHRRGTELLSQGQNYVKLAQNAFNKKLITRVLFNTLLAD